MAKNKWVTDGKDTARLPEINQVNQHFNGPHRAHQIWAIHGHQTWATYGKDTQSGTRWLSLNVLQTIIKRQRYISRTFTNRRFFFILSLFVKFISKTVLSQSSWVHKQWNDTNQAIITVLPKPNKDSTICGNDWPLSLLKADIKASAQIHGDHSY